jgi:hypothetical protein
VKKNTKQGWKRIRNKGERGYEKWLKPMRSNGEKGYERSLKGDMRQECYNSRSDPFRPLTVGVLIPLKHRLKKMSHNPLICSPACINVSINCQDKVIKQLIGVNTGLRMNRRGQTWRSGEVRRFHCLHRG